MLEMFVQHEQTHSPMPSPQGDRSASAARGPASWFTFGLISDLMRIIANLVYHNAVCQELIKKKECFPLILSRCRFDDANPQVREWALLAVHNLMDRNLENQAYVRTLGSVGVAPNDDLRDMGMTAMVDPDSGRMKIVQVGPLSELAKKTDPI